MRNPWWVANNRHSVGPRYSVHALGSHPQARRQGEGDGLIVSWVKTGSWDFGKAPRKLVETARLSSVTAHS